MYANAFKYTNEPIDYAIRKFLATFRLPGEGDQIHRIVWKFSTAYRNDNPSYFVEEDEEYILAYSLIILNTLNHNPSVDPKMKQTKEFFVH